MSLSNMFGDRILGGKRNVSYETDVEIQKPKLDIDVAGLKSKSNVFDELKIKEMTNKKDEIFKFISVKPEGMKTELLNSKTSTKNLMSPKFNKIKMPKEFNMKKLTNNVFKTQKMPNIMNTNKANSLFGNGKLPKGVDVSVLKKKMKGMESKAFSHIVRRPDLIGFTRVNNQKKLNMWGDADGDKVANILDCRPFDKNKQGALDTVKNFFTINKTPVEPVKPAVSDEFVSDDNYDTTGYKEVPKTNTEVVAPIQSYFNEQEPIDMNETVPNSTVTPVEPTAQEKLKAFIGSGVQKTGDFFNSTVGTGATFIANEAKDRWEEYKVDREKLRKVRLNAKANAILKADQLNQEDLYRKTYNKYLAQNSPTAQRVQSQSNKLYKYDPSTGEFVQTSKSAGKTKLQRAAGAVSDRAGVMAASFGGNNLSRQVGLRSTGLGVMQSVGGVGQGSFSSKVVNLVSSRNLTPEQISGAEPVSSQSYSQQIPVVQQQRMLTTGGEEFSGYKRLPDGRYKNLKYGTIVNYPRGTYDKGRNSYPQQRYQQGY